MSLNLWNTSVNWLFLGNTEIKKAYLGATLIYDKTVVPNWLLNNLISYYEFENNVLDSHWSNNWTDNWTSDIAWKILRGRSFDWANDYVLTWNIVWGNSQVSISCWVFMDSVTWIRPIMSDWATGTNEFLLRVNWGTLQWFLETSTAQYNLNTDTLTTWIWYNIVATYDWAIMKTYVNWTQSVSTLAATGTIKASPNDYIWRYSTLYFDWIIDELWVWSTWLTQVNIDDIYNSWIWLAYSDFTS